MKRARRADPAREAALGALRAITTEGAYANLALARQLQAASLAAADAGLVTELVAGTCRRLGTYDLIIESAGGRRLTTLQPAVVDALRLGCHQLLGMRIPAHAAVAATVDLAGRRISERVTGVVNAILHRVAERTLAQWLDRLAEGLDEVGRLALRTHHPRWIVEAYNELLPADEVSPALAANDEAPRTHVAVRPGLAVIADLPGVEPARYSPHGGYVSGSPGNLAPVADGRAGVQDEGSQLVALALTRPEAPAGPWLDLCAGPGGKSALLAGLAAPSGSRLVASELQPHRAELVAQNLRGYVTEPRPALLVADGRRPAWRPGSFARVLADVPCTGLGALRRRPDARWRKDPADLDELTDLQTELLETALAALKPGGVLAYVTCSPHRRETSGIVETVAARADVTVLDAAEAMPEVPDAALGPYVQLWPHRHGTDAMFLALLRRG